MLNIFLLNFLEGPRIGALLVGRSRDRFPVLLLDFSMTYFHGTGVDSARSENEYQEYSWG